MRQYHEEASAPQYNFPTFHVNGLSSAGLVGEIAMTVIIIVGMWRDGGSVMLAIVAGVVYFSLFHLIVMFVLSGTVRDVWINRQAEVTRRHEIRIIRANVNAATSTVRALKEVPPAAQLGASYLPAAEPNTIKDARLWLGNLYDMTDERGAVDPRKVNMVAKREPAGRLRVGAPAPDVLEYLLMRGILRQVQNGYALNVEDYPTIGCVLEAFFEERG